MFKTVLQFLWWIKHCLISAGSSVGLNKKNKPLVTGTRRVTGEVIGSRISKNILAVSHSSSKTSFLFFSFSLSSDDFNFILLRKSKYLIKNFRSSHYCCVCLLLQHPSFHRPLQHSSSQQGIYFCLRAFALAVSSAWNSFPRCPRDLLSLIMRSHLNCHFISKGCPSHPIYNYILSPQCYIPSTLFYVCP